MGSFTEGSALLNCQTTRKPSLTSSQACMNYHMLHPQIFIWGLFDNLLHKALHRVTKMQNVPFVSGASFIIYSEYVLAEWVRKRMRSLVLLCATSRLEGQCLLARGDQMNLQELMGTKGTERPRRSLSLTIKKKYLHSSNMFTLHSHILISTNYTPRNKKYVSHYFRKEVGFFF